MYASRFSGGRKAFGVKARATQARINMGGAIAGPRPRGDPTLPGRRFSRAAGRSFPAGRVYGCDGHPTGGAKSEWVTQVHPLPNQREGGGKPGTALTG